jgi:rubrerythrin
MATLVGTQTSFANALRALIELDFDAIEAYEAAINRIENEEYKVQLQNFKEDHQRHVQELNQLLTIHNEKISSGPDAKKWLTQGKVVISGIMGDNAILRAMLSNEEDTNTAYDRVENHPEVWADAKEILSAGFSDEKRHKRWLEENAK